MRSGKQITKDFSRDIDFTPEDYENYGGAGVRIRAYWTPECLENEVALNNSLIILRRANELLEKYTLSLDVVPRGIPARAPAPDSVHTATRARINQVAKHLPPYVRSVGGTLAGHVASAAINQLHTNQAHMELAKQQGRLEFRGGINIPSEGSPTVEELQKVRSVIDPVTEENRLIVVFVPFTEAGAPGGYSSRFAQWLPWVLVDPRKVGNRSTLLHEIGHACRLAHQKDPNIMYGYWGDSNHFWGWQVDEIYESYWCKGPKPKNWSELTLLPPGHPFLWGN